jgi:hypothetical protein
MRLQGLNITVQITRRTEGADDAIGGATRTAEVVLRNVRARISSMKPTEEARLQGLESSKLYNAVVVPANLDIRESDILIPDNGTHAGTQFRVTGVQKDSIHHNSKRAHMSLRLTHEDRARTVQ